MSITSLILSSLLMLPVSAAQQGELKALTSSEPKSALKLYGELLKQAQKEGNQDAIVALHLEGALAALNSRDWANFISIVEQLYDADLGAHVGPVKFNLITRIGVAYRYNNQLEQARRHYQCALRLSASDIELTLLKVNLAIVYRLTEQPAMAFQLINSIDEQQLSAKVKVGYWVVRGNILAALGEYKSALEYFEKAHLLYLKRNDRRAETLIKLNIMSTALAQQSLDKFLQYRTGYEPLLREQSLKSLLFLQWLDVIDKTIKKGTISEDDEAWLTENIATLIEQGYGVGIKAHLNIIDAVHLYPKHPPKRQGDNALPELMGKPWCPEL